MARRLNTTSPVPYRLDINHGENEVRVCFRGHLDPEALDDLVTHVAGVAGSANAVPVRVVLQAGTLVDHELVSLLPRLAGVTVEAESPFLARWMSRCVEEDERRRGAADDNRRTPAPHSGEANGDA